MIRALFNALLVVLIALVLILSWHGAQQPQTRTNRPSQENEQLLTAACAALEKLKRELAATRYAAALTAQELQQARADRDQHVAQIADLRSQLQGAQQDAAALAGTNYTLEQVQRQLRDAHASAAQGEQERAELQAKHGQAAGRVTALEAALATAEERARRSAQDVTAAQARIASLSAEKDTLQKDLASAHATNDTLHQQTQQLHAERARLNSAAQAQVVRDQPANNLVSRTSVVTPSKPASTGSKAALWRRVRLAEDEQVLVWGVRIQLEDDDPPTLILNGRYQVTLQAGRTYALPCCNLTVSCIAADLDDDRVELMVRSGIDR